VIWKSSLVILIFYTHLHFKIFSSGLEERARNAKAHKSRANARTAEGDFD
jgi:hypothetical protein